MISNHIGVIYVVETGEIRSVFNPDHDGQLDDPALVQSTIEGETLALLKIDRASDEYGVFGTHMTPGDCSVAVNVARRMIG